jgi:hypothetical protein
VQDGGVEGTIFNLVVLFIIATLAVYLWGPERAIGLFLFGVIGFNLITTYAFPSPGGGNSGATFFLATTLVGLAVVRLRPARTLVAAAVIVIDGAMLIATNDAHGIPILAGLAAGAGLAAVRSPRGLTRRSPPENVVVPRPAAGAATAGQRPPRLDSRPARRSSQAMGRAVGGMATGSTLSPLR